MTRSPETSTRPDAESRRRANDLAVAHLHLAEAVARRYFSHDPSRDEDLVQVAYLGLLKATRRFDPSRGDAFPAFAVPTISGEIKRHLRDAGWFIRPPRPLQEMQGRLAEAMPRLAQSLGREPSTDELVEELEVTRSMVEEAIACRRNLYAASIDVPVDDSGSATIADLVRSEDDEAGRADAAAMIWSAARVLTLRERRILYLRFYEERTQQEIGERLCISQMQVSRILFRVLSRLRDELEPRTAPERTARVQPAAATA